MVMLIGQAISLVPAFALFLFDDDKALGEESEPLMGRPAAPGPGVFGSKFGVGSGLCVKLSLSAVVTVKVGFRLAMHWPTQ